MRKASVVCHHQPGAEDRFVIRGNGGAQALAWQWGGEGRHSKNSNDYDPSGLGVAKVQHPRRDGAYPAGLTTEVTEYTEKELNAGMKGNAICP